LIFHKCSNSIPCNFYITDSTLLSYNNKEQAFLEQILDGGKITMKRKQLRFIGYCLAIGLISALIMVTLSCSSKSTTSTPKVPLYSVAIAPASPTNLKVGSTQQFAATGTYSDGSTADITSKVTWASDNITAATIAPSGLATSVAPGNTNITATMSGITSSAISLRVVSAYQGSGTGTWSGTILYNNKTYDVGGTITAAIDANGVATGSMTGTQGGSVSTTMKSMKVDTNGNVTGTSSFVIDTTTYDFTFQGKVTVSGTTISFSGTWTGQLGSGVFSLTGTTSS